MILVEVAKPSYSREEANASDEDSDSSVPLTLVMRSCCFLAPGGRSASREEVAIRVRGDAVWKRTEIDRTGGFL